MQPHLYRAVTHRQHCPNNLNPAPRPPSLPPPALPVLVVPRSHSRAYLTAPLPSRACRPPHLLRDTLVSAAAATPAGGSTMLEAGRAAATAQADGDLFAITHVGPYLLTEALGCGNYGKVRKAIHTTTRQEVAIKAVPNASLSRTLPLNIDIRREMSIQQALSHENIIELHEVIVANAHVYLVMEYACHGDFFRIISRRGRLAEKTAHAFFRQLVSAVQYCHAKGVYHRDLKPENLLLAQSGQLKLTDFGFSAMKDHGPPVLKTNCGSPHYCAPEVWNGTQEGYDGRKSDAFSAGVVLYVMLTGTQPFYDDDEDRLLRKVNRCRVAYPEWLPADARDLLSKLLVKDPQVRWGLDMVRLHPWFVQGAQGTKEPAPRRACTQRAEFQKTKAEAVDDNRVYDGSLLMSARALMRVF